ncbi:MAG: sugar ABC transporter substrate-binding protein [Firmicutes bacterium]|nr:sugar ABC transporter substrate-binding protein [Bacillota bacterium]
MRKVLILLVIVLLTVSLGSFGVTAADKLIGYTVPDTAEPFLSQLTNDVKELFAKDGVEVQIANPAGDASKQISQVENFAAMGADLIIIMAVDPTSMEDVIKRAQAAGSKVMVAGSDPGAYDAIMYIDQYEDGKLIAKMAVDWINETFPDAETGSIKTAIFESRDTPEASDRCDGITEISNMTSAVDVVKVVGGIKNIAAAQNATENLLLTNPDVRLILTYNSGGAIGASSVVMRPGSPIDDKSKFAVFGSDLDPQSLQAVKDSANNESVLRGIVKFGSNDLAGDTYRLASKMINGEEYDKMNPDPLTPITPENADDF